jgi:hypothetical protein
MKNQDNYRPLENLSIWTVWYQDRFATGSDRDPASLVALFLDKKEADHYINTHEGRIDIQSGKFDGLFLKKWEAVELVGKMGVTEEVLQNLLAMKAPAQLRKHWEKGWIS